jgi:hypothetical protein
VKVRVSYPVFNNGKVDHLLRMDLDGEVEEDQFGFVVWVPLAEVQRAISGAPDTTSGLIITRKNSVTFQPYLAPRTELSAP